MFTDSQMFVDFDFLVTSVSLSHIHADEFWRPTMTNLAALAIIIWNERFEWSNERFYQS